MGNNRDGRILDGRGRQQACEDVGVEPKYKTFKGNDEQATQFVIAMNIARRHLDSSQRAASAANAMEWYRIEAAKRKAEGQKNGGEIEAKRPDKGKKKPLDGKNSVKGSRTKPAEEAVAKAAADFKTNPKYVAAAEKIKGADPDLFRRVEQGTIKIPQALKLLKKREEEEEQQKQRDLDPNWVDWDKEVKGFRKHIEKFSLRVAAFENECRDICVTYEDVKDHMDTKESEAIRRDCFLEAHVTMKRCVVLFEQFKEGMKS